MASFEVIRAVVFVLAVFGNLVNTNQVLWSDEFNGTAGSQPSKDLWTYTVGDRSYRGVRECSSSSELQYYTDKPSNVALDGQGNLVITARLTDSPLHDSDKCACGNCRFTSALLVSKFNRRYGRFEARIKLPSGKGVWPAFILLGDTLDCVGWPNTGEIDVMEMRGSRPNTILGSIHGPGYSGGISSMFTLQGGQTFEEDYHVFAIDWEANRITWSVDDDVYVSRTPDDLGQSPWVFDHPFHVLIGLAVGGLFDGAPTSHDFPKKMYIDYIRVYEKIPGISISYSNIMKYTTNVGPLVWSAEFNSASGTSPADQWNYDLTDGPNDNKGWGNAEHQYYTNETVNCATDGQGHLVISARNDNTEPYTCFYGDCLFTSARLTTYRKFGHRYGRFEARLKMPSGKGIWPAFWLLGDNIETVLWPKCGTIAMEMRGSTPNVVTATIHGPGYQSNRGIQASYKLPGERTFADDFHVFAIDWEANRLTFSIDDTSFRTMTPADLNGNPWVFDHSFHIILNLAVGGAYDGYPPKDTVFPKMYYIDYVRVYDLV